MDALQRLLKPASVAVVGLSDSSPFSRQIAPTLDSDATVLFVNPKHRTVFDRPTVPTLADLDRPVDVVLSVLPAASAVDVAEQAAAIGAGGLVLVSAGFAEVGGEGAVLQDRLAAVARGAGMPVMGPNGLGYVDAHRGVSLTLAPPYPLRPGGLSVVSQSGAMLTGVAIAARQHRGIGLHLLISAGNEAVTDLADYVDFLAGDPDTGAIGLIVETIRRPAEFFAAVARAHRAGKPVVVLKLARTGRSRAIAVSHTAAVTGDAWVYDVALRQAGVAIAEDPEDLLDRLQFFDQFPPERWSAVTGLAVLGLTGGYASLAYDVATQEGVRIPELAHLGGWVRATIAGVSVPNPLDATGLGAMVWDQVVERYTADPAVDSVLFVHPLAPEDEGHSEPLVRVVAGAAGEDRKPYVLASVSGTPDGWTDAHRGAMALGRGLRPTLRGLQTMGAFVRHRDRSPVAATAAPPALSRPGGRLVDTPAGAMLPFAASMELLRTGGIPVAPYHVVTGDRPDVPFPGPYAVKLADLAHRATSGAVRLGVDAQALPAAVRELRDLAGRIGASPEVVVQPMVRALGELFVGVRGRTELGPLVAFGAGGALVEAQRRVGGRMAPLSRDDALSLVDEFPGPAWDREGLADVLVAAGALAAAGTGWLTTLDVNPLTYGPDGPLAVDALCLVSAEEPAG